ncbi:ParB N-terminal domain-containing protein [Conexivisphaera calida]|uniref:ParB N-terminal domain-containing protein n=1 Tax=Conexivisphaera calida TaxID=1874277 RepID=UPI00157A7B2E|nr:ParB N-terminal domain-containing protein [Conexivisphaera calida]
MSLGEPVRVPLDDCEPDPRFLYRVRYDVDDLVESIRRGQINPALARRREDGKYMVFAGVRRLMAARAARERYGEPETFLVRLVSPDTPVEEMWRLALDENITQRKITPLDLVKAARMAPEAAIDAIHVTNNAYNVKELKAIAARITDEELEDLTRVEEHYTSWARVESHLVFEQIAGLTGLDRYTRIVAAWLSLDLRFDLSDERDRERVAGMIRSHLIPDPLQPLLRGLEPPRVEEAPAQEERAAAAQPPAPAPEPEAPPVTWERPRAPSAPAQPGRAPAEAPPAQEGRVEPSHPEEAMPVAPEGEGGPAEPEEEEERVYTVLLKQGEDEFVFECPAVGSVRIRIARIG